MVMNRPSRAELFQVDWRSPSAETKTQEKVAAAMPK